MKKINSMGTLVTCLVGLRRSLASVRLGSAHLADPGCALENPGGDTPTAKRDCRLQATDAAIDLSAQTWRNFRVVHSALYSGLRAIG